jgi:hypothetical protein
MSAIMENSPLAMIDTSPPLLNQKEGRHMDALLHSPLNSRKEEGEMMGFDLWTEIHARARRGEAKPKMARELGLARKTVRRLLAQERPVP